MEMRRLGHFSRELPGGLGVKRDTQSGRFGDRQLLSVLQLKIALYDVGKHVWWKENFLWSGIVACQVDVQ